MTLGLHIWDIGTHSFSLLMIYPLTLDLNCWGFAWLAVPQPGHHIDMIQFN